eukprot:2394735-Pyramimonas_sp.AAC.1
MSMLLPWVSWRAMTARCRMKESSSCRLRARRDADLPLSACVFPETRLKPSGCGFVSHGDHRVPPVGWRRQQPARQPRARAR